MPGHSFLKERILGRTGKSVLLLSCLLAIMSCATGRYAAGPSSSQITSLPGYDGTIEAVPFNSREPGLRERRMVVYLPPSYYSDTLRRYPVLYLLHGARGNEATWIERGRAFRSLDSLRRENKAREFILVLPNVNRYYGDDDYKNGRAVNAARAFWFLNGEAERYFMPDVVSRTDSLYRTIPEKRGRAIAGMSTGALQCLYLSASHPDAFDYVGLFSPYAAPTFAAWGHPDAYGRLSPKLKRQFVHPPQAYLIYIGRGDIFRPHMELYNRRLNRHGYPHEFILSEGGHEWYNWSAYLVDFYQRLF